LIDCLHIGGGILFQTIDNFYFLARRVTKITERHGP